MREPVNAQSFDTEPHHVKNFIGFGFTLKSFGTASHHVKNFINL